jgi:hypothetical protein
VIYLVLGHLVKIRRRDMLTMTMILMGEEEEVRKVLQILAVPVVHSHNMETQILDPLTEVVHKE